MKNIKDFYKSLILSTAICVLCNTSAYSDMKSIKNIYTRNSDDIYNKYKDSKIENIELADIEDVEKDIINNIEWMNKEIPEKIDDLKIQAQAIMDDAITKLFDMVWKEDENISK